MCRHPPCRDSRSTKVSVFGDGRLCRKISKHTSERTRLVPGGVARRGGFNSGIITYNLK